MLDFYKRPVLLDLEMKLIMEARHKLFSLEKDDKLPLKSFFHNTVISLLDIAEDREKY